MNIKLIAKTNCEFDALHVAEVAGVCYNRKDKSDKTCDEILEQLKSFWLKKHYSPFEFIDYDFEITDISIVALKQITRHWNSNMMVKSGRYCKEKNISFYFPESIINSKSINDEYMAMLTDISKFYDKMIKLGINTEDARYILPQALITEMRFKISLRDFLCSFYPQRHSKKAQKEIRDIATDMMDAIRSDCSATMLSFLDWYMEEGIKSVER